MPDYYYLILGLLLLVALAALVAKRRSSKIDHLPPEHRAKENELYEALGLEKPHAEEEPKDHEDKQEEMEAVFRKK
jgi:LPXTG-motif cell wall-anchored protein